VCVCVCGEGGGGGGGSCMGDQEIQIYVPIYYLHEGVCVFVNMEDTVLINVTTTMDGRVRLTKRSALCWSQTHSSKSTTV
jgi:hypothetical protein